MNEKDFETMHGYFLEELKVGQEETIYKKVSSSDINDFSKITGDYNPVHINERFAEKTIFKKTIAHGFLTASFISSVIGTKLPGPGCIYLKQSLKFLAPVYPGDNIKVNVKIKTIIVEKKRIILETYCSVGDKKVLEGEAEILVNKKK